MSRKCEQLTLDNDTFVKSIISSRMNKQRRQTKSLAYKNISLSRSTAVQRESKLFRGGKKKQPNKDVSLKFVQE